MHALHARLPKNFVLEERLERFGAYIEPAPWTLKGHWAQACYPSLGIAQSCTKHSAVQAMQAVQEPLCFDTVHLDLGCGKGVFTCDIAAQHPNILFIGMDSEPICIAYAAAHAHEAQLPNVLFVPGHAAKLNQYFSAGEIGRIYLNFPTPFPRKKECAHRLTHAHMLDSYREVLAPDGSIRLKTDSIPLYRFSLTQIEPAGYKLNWKSDNVRELLPHEPATGYELRLTAQGASVHGFEIVPGPRPASIELPMSMGLVDYLPKNLSELTYIPHGMEGTITNLRNRQFRSKTRSKNKRS